MGGTAAVVLVVEDEFLIRMDAVEMLEAAGFATIEAANADEAIRIFESRDDIRVLVTDTDLPGLKLVVVSGKRTPRFEELPADALFYGKPYDMDEVTAGIGKLLAT